MRIAVCGGVYSNPYALSAFVENARACGAERLYCLGDLGGYGAEPDAVWPLLLDNDVICIAGNYDVAIAAGDADCGCGYSDPRDQQYSQVMYDFTLANTRRDFAGWMADLPIERREVIAGQSVHFVHGSPLGLNDFWWESLSPEAHALKVAASGADIVVATHSGLPWVRRFGGTLVVNIGVIGRPANDGMTDVSYALIDINDSGVTAQIQALPYDWRAQVASMRRARLPEAFVRTNETGWWATCLQILPLVERSRGRYHVYDSSVETMLAATGIDASWPDNDHDVPVRSLVGSPLLPGRIRVTDDHPMDPDAQSLAATLGFTDIISLRGTVPERSPVVELTVSSRGWFLHPDLLGEDPIRAVEQPDDIVASDDVAGAVRAAVHSVLVDLHKASALAPPRYCVS